MASAITPIAAGALYRDVTDDSLLRVKSVWIDEDTGTNIQIMDEVEAQSPGRTSSETVTKDDVLDRLDAGELERANTDHEAWEWRHDR